MRPVKAMVPIGLSLLILSLLNMSRAVDKTADLLYSKPGSINALMEVNPTYTFKVCFHDPSPFIVETTLFNPYLDCIGV